MIVPKICASSALINIIAHIGFSGSQYVHCVPDVPEGHQYYTLVLVCF